MEAYGTHRQQRVVINLRGLRRRNYNIEGPHQYRTARNLLSHIPCFPKTLFQVSPSLCLPRRAVQQIRPRVRREEKRQTRTTPNAASSMDTTAI